MEVPRELMVECYQSIKNINVMLFKTGIKALDLVYLEKRLKAVIGEEDGRDATQA